MVLVDAANTLTTLTRLARRQNGARQWLSEALEGRLDELAVVAVDVAIETGEPMGRVLAEGLRAQGTDELAEKLVDRFDEFEIEGSVPLRMVIFEATRLCWLGQRAVAGADDGEWPQAEFARLSCNLSIALGDLDRQEEALEAAQEAVALFRGLEGESAGEYSAQLAQSLNVVASACDELGRASEARDHIREAVAIHRRLAAERPEMQIELAVSLNNLGGALFSLGRAEEALAAIREAIAIRRRLLAEEAGRSLADIADLADNLDNLGTALMACERPAEAREATLEAIELYRQLAAERPDVFPVDLARSLSNLGQILLALDQPEEAAVALAEASRLSLRPAAEQPGVG